MVSHTSFLIKVIVRAGEIETARKLKRETVANTGLHQNGAYSKGAA